MAIIACIFFLFFGRAYASESVKGKKITRRRERVDCSENASSDSRLGRPDVP